MNDKEIEQPVGGTFGPIPTIAGEQRMKQAAMNRDVTDGHIPAEGAIRNRIEGLRREIAGLDALLRTLPREMPLEADEALWKLVISQR